MASRSQSIAALQRQLSALQKQLLKALKSTDDKTAQVRVEALSSQIALVQSQLGQMLQQQAAAQALRAAAKANGADEGGPATEAALSAAGEQSAGKLPGKRRQARPAVDDEPAEAKRHRGSTRGTSIDLQA